MCLDSGPPTCKIIAYVVYTPAKFSIAAWQMEGSTGLRKEGNFEKRLNFGKVFTGKASKHQMWWDILKQKQ